MASPAELTKLGFKERLQKLGIYKYIVIAGWLALFLGAIEITRYNDYDACIKKETEERARIYASLQEEIDSFAKDPNSIPKPELLIEHIKKIDKDFLDSFFSSLRNPNAVYEISRDGLCTSIRSA